MVADPVILYMYVCVVVCGVTPLCSSSSFFYILPFESNLFVCMMVMIVMTKWYAGGCG